MNERGDSRGNRLHVTPALAPAVLLLSTLIAAAGGEPVLEWPPALPGGAAVPHVRSATAETADGIVYGTSGRDCLIWAFDVKTAETALLGNGAVGTCTYTTSMDVDPTGRYLYYVPGAHGGGAADGSPVIQFDARAKRPKVLAFLRAIKDQAGCEFEGTFSTALDAKGETLYVTWNVRRPATPRAWDCCALTVIHIPESERRP